MAYINTFVEQRDAFSMNIMEVGTIYMCVCLYMYAFLVGGWGCMH